jgi:hypothetical protein
MDLTIFAIIEMGCWFTQGANRSLGATMKNHLTNIQRKVDLIGLKLA